MENTKKQIGKVSATVEMPIFENDNIDHDFNWYWEYSAPDLTNSGELGLFKRQLKVIEMKKELFKKEEKEK